MSDFESIIEKAVEDRVIPGVVLLAKDKSGKLDYARALGYSSLEPGAEVPLDLHSLFTLMSMTKLLTVVAALQQVDLGRITLDEDVSPLVPLLAAQPVLAGFDDAGAPRLEPRNRPITLRHLLTHSAGTAYDFLQPALQQYRKAIGKPPAVPDMTGSMEERLAYPLLFQPGEGWVYGTGNDWAGRIVEKLSGLTLEEYFKTQLLPAIGGGVVTFFPTREPAVEARLWSSLPVRDAETGKMVHGPAPPAAASECYGGSGGYADVTVYINLLGSLLADDGRLLRPETAALLFQPQLGPAAKKMLLVETEARNSGWIVGSIPDTGEYDWSLAGLLVDGDSHPLRKRGAALWGGMFNLAWIIDRTAGVAAIFATNMLPPGDAEVRDLITKWETYVYSKAEA